MSHGGEIFGLGGETASEPNFETALRGYEKKQVERYVARAEIEAGQYPTFPTLLPLLDLARAQQG